MMRKTILYAAAAVALGTTVLVAQLPKGGAGSSGGGGTGTPNNNCTFMSSATTCAITGLSLPSAQYNTSTVQCWIGASTTGSTQTALAATWAPTIAGGVVTTVTASFSAASGAGYCVLNNSGVNGPQGVVGPTGPTGPSSIGIESVTTTSRTLSCSTDNLQTVPISGSSIVLTFPISVTGSCPAGTTFILNPTGATTSTARFTTNGATYSQNGTTANTDLTLGACATAPCPRYIFTMDSSGTNWVLGGGSTGGGGSGTVTVVGGGNLTSSQVMTGGGSQTAQTPNANTTLDSSGNFIANTVSSLQLANTFQNGFTFSSGTSNPATCTANFPPTSGSWFYRTDLVGSTTQSPWQFCHATNTWESVGPIGAGTFFMGGNVGFGGPVSIGNEAFVGNTPDVSALTVKHTSTQTTGNGVGISNTYVWSPPNNAGAFSAISLDDLFIISLNSANVPFFTGEAEDLRLIGPGSVTNMQQHACKTPTISGGATVTNSFCMVIPNMNAAGITNGYIIQTGNGIADFSAATSFKLPPASTGTTQTCGDNSTNVATTAYVGNCPTFGGTNPNGVQTAGTVTQDVNFCNRMTIFNGTTSLVLANPVISNCPFLVLNIATNQLSVSRNGINFNGGTATPPNIPGCASTGYCVTTTFYSDTNGYWSGTGPQGAPAQTTSGTSVSLASGAAQNFVCTGTCTVTVPLPAQGASYCVWNDDNTSATITMSALGGGASYENTARTAYGTAGTGTLSATAAVGNKVCIVFRDTTHYQTLSYYGAWTAN